MKNKFFKKIPQSFYTIFSLAAVAAINYSIIHNSIIFVFLMVLLAHELGHYFVAKKHKGKPRLPIFIPLPFFVIGLTKISKLTSRAQKEVAFYGPFVGFLTTLLLILLNGIFNFMSYIPLLFLLFTETVLNYFGTDGSKYRKAKRSTYSCI